MKRFVSFIVTLLLSLAAYSQTGTWSGKVDVQGTSLSVVFHIEETGCTFDSPDQGAKRIPAEASLSDLGKVVIKVPSIGATFEGLWLGGRIVGSLSQSGSSFPLTLVPGEPELKRPQTPVGPFPYSCEEVSFSNGDAVLKGTLVLPEGYTRDTPAVIMVTGTGQQNRDEEIFEHKPFAVIADALARNGIASLRYDDRGFGESTGDAVFCTTADLKYDALAGIGLLRERFGRVGVIGHSEGGTIAIMIAAEGKADFIVSLAGPACKIDTMLMVQLNSLARVQGYNGQLVKDVATARQYMTINDKSAWMKAFVDMDATPYVKATTCPVLALAGDKDLNVPVSINNPSLEANLKKQPKTKIKVYPGLSHLFQHSTTGNPMDAAKIDETIAPEVLTDIAEWITSVTR